MALSNEDYKDVKREMGDKTASKVSHATHDRKPATFKSGLTYRIVTDKERKRNPYLSADSRVYKREKPTSKILSEAKNKAIHAKKKEYTGHYQEDGAGKIRHQSPKQVLKKNLGQY